MDNKTDVFGFLDFGMFPDYCLFSCGFSYKEIVAELKKKEYNSWINAVKKNKHFIEKGNWYAIKTIIKTEIFYLIIVPKTFNFYDEHYVNLAHECLHICQFYLPNYLDRNKELEA